MTGFDKLALSRAMLGALLVVSGTPAVAEVRPVAVGEGQPAPRVLLFRVLVREYLEFRVGSQVTIRSNAGQVVITAMDPRARSDAMAGAQAAANQLAPKAAARTNAGAGSAPLMPAARAVVADADKIGATDVCLYVEGSKPTCGDLSEVAGQVVYTAANP